MSTKKLRIVGGKVLPMDSELSVIESGYVDVENGAIVRVGTTDDLGSERFDGDVLDARGALVMPGFINAHAHSGMTLLRGVGDDMALMPWLEKRIFPLERKFNSPEFVTLGVKLAAAEMLKAGVTTVNDMYYSMAHAARAFDEAGMRCVAGQTIIEASGVADPSATVGGFEVFLDQVSELPLVIPAITPHSVYAMSEKVWAEVIDFARDNKVFLHTHLSETYQENQDCKAKFGKTPTKLLEDWGVWDLPAIAAHAVHLNDEDIEILAEFQIGVSHNPQSNLKLGSGIAPVPDMRNAGIAVALGTDGTSSNNDLDVLAEGALAAMLQSYVSGPGSLPAREVVKMLTIEGARALRLDDRIGSLEPGKRADIVVMDLRKPHAVPMFDPYSHLIYSAKSSDVRHTIVDGQVVVKDGKLTTLDEAGLLEEATEYGVRIRDAMAESNAE